MDMVFIRMSVQLHGAFMLQDVRCKRCYCLTLQLDCAGLATPSAESIFMRRSRLPQIPQAASKLPLDRKVDSAGTYVDRSHATQGRTLQVNVFAQDDSQSSTDTREVTAPVLSNQLSFPLSSAAQYNVENADASGELSASHSDTIPDWVAQAASFNNPMTTGPSLNNPMTAFVERVDDDSPKVDSGTIERAYGEATSQPTSTTKIADTADGKMLLGDSAPQVRGSCSQVGNHRTLKLPLVICVAHEHSCSMPESKAPLETYKGRQYSFAREDEVVYRMCGCAQKGRRLLSTRGVGCVWCLAP